MRSVYVIVMDSVGVGAAPDAERFGDAGADTFSHVIEGEDLSQIDLLLSLGMKKLCHPPLEGEVTGVWGKMQEKSAGKDTTSGHWELCGLVTEKPMPTYPNGFPKRIIDRFEQETGRKVIGNKAASGTEIIKELGEEHIKTGALIVYTSADSVFQIAAHEEVVPIEQLYHYCEIAREIMSGDDACGRIIARPFVGSPGNFVRTLNRKDFSLKPQGKTILNVLQEHGVRTTAVGKINDIFCGEGISDPVYAHGNQQCCQATLQLIQEKREGFIFVNLVDFDSNYGHRNDKEGYFRCLVEFNQVAKQLISLCDDETCILITADHGCDPTDASTDHSREYVPVLVYRKGIQPGEVGVRDGFGDLGATVCELLGCTPEHDGKSFADVILR